MAAIVFHFPVAAIFVLWSRCQLCTRVLHFSFLYRLLLAYLLFLPAVATLAQTPPAEREYQKGLALFEEKKYDAAIAAFAAALELQPGYEEVYKKKSHAYRRKISNFMDAGHYDQAKHLVQTVLHTVLRENDGEGRCKTLNLLASAHYELGDFSASIQVWLQSLDLARQFLDRNLQAEALNGLAGC